MNFSYEKKLKNFTRKRIQNYSRKNSLFIQRQGEERKKRKETFIKIMECKIERREAERELHMCRFKVEILYSQTKCFSTFFDLWYPSLVFITMQCGSIPDCKLLQSNSIITNC